MYLQNSLFILTIIVISQANFSYMRYCTHTLCLLLLTQVKLFSQNLTGTWEGRGGGSDYCKLVIVHVGDSLYGFTYDTGMGYCKCNFAGKYNDSLKKLNGTNTSVIEKTLTHSMSSYRLNYSKEGDREFLKGGVGAKSVGAKILSFGLSQPVSYTKTAEEADTTVYMAARLRYYYNKTAVPEQGVVKNTAPEIITDTVAETITAPVAVHEPGLKTVKESRRSELVKTFDTKEDSVKLVLFDNGEIDGDTVTVFLNGSIIINRLGLSVHPFEMYIPVAKNGAVQVIELMANNLGSIPPNTAYMQVWEKDKRHELRVSSDLNTNARIDIKYKPD